MEEYDKNPPTKLSRKINKSKILHIATFNVRSLSTIQKYIELTHAIQKIKVDILGLAETRKMGCKIEEHSNHIFCYIGETPGLYGVGFLIKKEFKENIIHFNGLSERIALLQMKFNSEDIYIIQAYAPTQDANEEDIETYLTLYRLNNAVSIIKSV